MNIVNRRAKHDYRILQSVEAGIVLSGAEVKSLREGRGSLQGAFARIKNSEVWLYRFDIQLYKQAEIKDYDPLRPKKLLLHRKEIVRLAQKVERGNLSLIPMRCYISGKFVKVELGLAKGKKIYEKREEKKRRDLQRELEREYKGRG